MALKRSHPLWNFIYRLSFIPWSFQASESGKRREDRFCATAWAHSVIQDAEGGGKTFLWGQQRQERSYGRALLFWTAAGGQEWCPRATLLGLEAYFRTELSQLNVFCFTPGKVRLEIKQPDLILKWALPQHFCSLCLEGTWGGTRKEVWNSPIIFLLSHTAVHQLTTKPVLVSGLESLTRTLPSIPDPILKHWEFWPRTKSRSP